MDFLTDTNNLLILVVAFISGMMLMFPSLSKRGGQFLSPSQATQKINQQNAILIDIRATDSYKAGHIAQSRHIEAADLVNKTEKIAKDKPIILVCDSGRNASRQVATLRKQGFNDVSVLEGGLMAWTQAGLPLKKS
ncbi:rhodanese-like domain-containing protein [Paenalcaligenes hominis]|uniref:rhodanese-like domain-containing protein n=1 Tax=Paenalcaligenes hominis TaxID=643674 RepID=UPI0035266843